LGHELVRHFSEIQPRIIITQPYEGGHPDHDATAFAVHIACSITARENNLQPIIVEMSAYHNSRGSMATGKFLPPDGCEVLPRVLSNEERQFKRNLFACFKTQLSVLKYFPIDVEVFREAPNYDFAAPPHSGPLYYEFFDWNMTGPLWRELAREALLEIEDGHLVRPSQVSANSHAADSVGVAS
jgi:LmbE family N-acetylglucosaminyl deacetylase